MNRAELVRRITKLARKRGVAVRFDERHGKGSHGRLWYGERFSTVPSGEIAKGTLHAILKQLGLSLDDLR